MFNSTVTGITNFITMSALGWVDTYFAVIVPAFCTTFGLYLMKQFMETSVTDAVLESARLDGASENKIFWKIAMPMVKPAWITLIIFAFKDLWNSGAAECIVAKNRHGETGTVKLQWLPQFTTFADREWRHDEG